MVCKRFNLIYKIKRHIREDSFKTKSGSEDKVIKLIPIDNNTSEISFQLNEPSQDFSKTDNSINLINLESREYTYISF